MVRSASGAEAAAEDGDDFFVSTQVPGFTPRTARQSSHYCNHDIREARRAKEGTTAAAVVCPKVFPVLAARL